MVDPGHDHSSTDLEWFTGTSPDTVWTPTSHFGASLSVDESLPPAKAKEWVNATRSAITCLPPKASNALLFVGDDKLLHAKGVFLKQVLADGRTAPVLKCVLVAREIIDLVGENT